MTNRAVAKSMPIGEVSSLEKEVEDSPDIHLVRLQEPEEVFFMEKGVLFLKDVRRMGRELYPEGNVRNGDVTYFVKVAEEPHYEWRNDGLKPGSWYEVDEVVTDGYHEKHPRVVVEGMEFPFSRFSDYAETAEVWS